MADFKTHITTSTVLGIGYGATAYALYQVPVETAILSAGLCSVSGMLPDIDSDSGVPLRESIAFAAAVVPMMLFDRLHGMGLSHEWMTLVGMGCYLFIRFGFAAILKKYTVHRGMFHSIPAALLFAELAFLLSTDLPTALRYYKAGAVLLGYLSHLLLDELWAFKVVRGRIRLKSSFGTALKFWGQSWWSNASTYLKLGVLTFLVMQDPAVVAQLQSPETSGRVARAVQSGMVSLKGLLPGGQAEPPAEEPLRR